MHYYWHTSYTKQIIPNILIEPAVNFIVNLKKYVLNRIKSINVNSLTCLGLLINPCSYTRRAASVGTALFGGTEREAGKFIALL